MSSPPDLDEATLANRQVLDIARRLAAGQPAAPAAPRPRCTQPATQRFANSYEGDPNWLQFLEDSVKSELAA
jgi:hypothetical protein